MSKANADAVAERRLRPIYDWLDNGNNKKAIQEADKVLKKQPDLLCAKVLKGLALLRLGKSKDCEEILDGVKKEVPFDDCTLQAMTICYREIHKLENICDLYEKALLKDPLNEELNTHLFMAYVRVGDYKKQQQVALNLYKIKPKNPYYFWGVMSILMQAQNNDEKIAQKVTLPLAERMVKKFIDEGKIEAEQEIQLYIMILEMQNKHEEALEMIDGELGRKVTSYYMFSRKRIKLLQALEMWKDLNVYIKKMLLDEPDAFTYYVTYIESVFKLIEQEKNSPGNESDSNSSSYLENSLENGGSSDENYLKNPDNTIELCVSFIKKCQDHNQQPHKLRGPYLASFVLYNKLIEEGYDPVCYLGTVYNMCKNYFTLFADKACCFKDLYQFLPLVQNERKSLLKDTLNIIKEIDSDVKNKKHMMMYLTYLQLDKYYCNYEKMYSIDDNLARISELINFYNNSHRFNEHVTATDLACNDTFIILVAHTLYDMYLNTCDFKFIKDAICLLEYAYNYSISNHHFKLLLLKFYNLLGATKAGYKYFQLLEIKHMQYDSLGYLECWPLLYSGQYSLAVHLLDNTLKFFNVNYKEAADQLTHAYKYGSFEKVNEFLNFREKLKNSFHYSLVTIEHLIHDITHLPSHEATIQTVQHISINPERSTVSELDHLVDNRDLYLFLNFDPEFKIMNEKYAKLSFEHEVSLIRLRTMILRCIGASVNVSLYAVPAKANQTNDENSYANSNGVDDPSVKHLDIFFNVIEELKELNKSFVDNFPVEIPKDVFSGVDQSRLFLYGKSPYFLPFLIDGMSFAHQFCSHCLIDNSTDKEIEQMAEISAKQFSKLLSHCYDRIQGEISCLQDDRRELFEFLSLIVEIFCISCIICGNLYWVLSMSSKKTNAPVRRKKKKGGKEIVKQVEASTDEKDQIEKGVVKVFTYYLSIVRNHIRTFELHLTLLESCWSKLETYKPKFELQYYQSSEQNLTGDDPVIKISEQKWSQIQTAVNENLKDSYRSSVQEIRSMVKQKIEYLTLLSF